MGFKLTYAGRHAGKALLELAVFASKEVDFALLGLEELLGELLVAGERVVEGGRYAGVGGDRLVLS